MKIKKPFDLEKAKNGAEVVTRGGLSYTFLRLLKDKSSTTPVLGYFVDSYGNEISIHSQLDGIYSNPESEYDLFILEEPKQWWTNVYRAKSGDPFTIGVFGNKELAEEEKDKTIYTHGFEYIKTILLHEE